MCDKSIDSLIFMFSGHGTSECILSSDFNRNGLGEISITDIQQWFGGKNVRSYFLSCPKLVILDMCRGNMNVQTIKHKEKHKGDKITYKRHPVQDYAIFFSNAKGYTSSNAVDCSGGHLITAFCKVLSNRNNTTNYDISSLQKMVRKEVMTVTNSSQCIEFSDMLTNDAFFTRN